MKKHNTLLISLIAGTLCTATHAQRLPMQTRTTDSSIKDSTNLVVNQQIQSTKRPAWHPQALFTFSEGSLKDNIEHAAKQFGWKKIVWQPHQDYQWVGETKIAATGLTDLLTKVLEHYPLQAVFYEGNHVLVITSRNI